MCGGFTLAEITVVGAILGLVSMVGWPVVRGVSQRLAARADAERWIAALRAEREQAVMSGASRSTTSPSGTIVTFSADGSATAARVSFGPADAPIIDVDINESAVIERHER